MEKPILMLGGLCLDRYYLLDRFPVQGQDTFVNDAFEQIGGCPVNAAYTLKKFGMEPVLYSAIGSESQAAVHAFFRRHQLSEEGLYEVTGQKTGFCVILLDEKKERTFMTYRGCEGLFDRSRVPALPFQACYLTGLYLVYGKESEKVVDYLSEFCGEGYELFFDPGPLCDQIDPVLLERVLNLCTHLKVNREEQSILETQLNKPLSTYFSSRCQALIITRGSQGSRLITPQFSQEFPAIPIQAADSNGAGDAFFAGYTASVLQGKKLTESMKIASACGALTASELGPHADYRPEEILKLVQAMEKDA